jgi:hypothetical protein
MNCSAAQSGIPRNPGRPLRKQHRPPPGQASKASHELAVTASLICANAGDGSGEIATDCFG